MDVVVVDTQHRIKVLRPNHFDACPDALLPAPRGQRGAVMTARDGPVPEIACLGMTLRIWQAKLLAHFAYTDASNGPTESLDLKIKIAKHTAARIPQLRQLPALPTSQPRPNPGESPDITDPSPQSQLGGVGPEIPNMRGLPDRIPATRDRHP
jgi:Transposase